MVNVISAMLCLVSITSYASPAVTQIPLQKNHFFRLDKSYEISGATVVKNRFYVVTDNDSEKIYEWDPKNTEQELTTAIDLTKINGYRNYSAANKINFEGISYCKNAFYIVNEKNNDVLKITNKNFSALPIDKNVFDFNSDKKGLEGIAIDCKGNRLFVSNQANPQRVFVFNLLNSTHLTTFDLSEQGVTKENNISDLFFENGYLYVLQKNRTSILMIHIHQDQQRWIKRLDYSAFSGLYDAFDKEGNKKSKDFAEGLTVLNGTEFYLFYDQGEATSVSDRGEQLGLEPDERGIVAHLSQ